MGKWEISSVSVVQIMSAGGGWWGASARPGM